MSPATIFNIHLGLGYVPWLLCFSAYIWPRLKLIDSVEAQRAIATLHSFRPGLPAPRRRRSEPASSLCHVRRLW